MRATMMHARLGGMSEMYARPSAEEADAAMRQLLQTAQRKLGLTSSLPHVRSMGLSVRRHNGAARDGHRGPFR